jgi:hypothetical protein
MDFEFKLEMNCIRCVIKFLTINEKAKHVKQNNCQTWPTTVLSINPEARFSRDEKAVVDVDDSRTVAGEFQLGAGSGSSSNLSLLGFTRLAR